jgi:hypothetical protein
MIFKHKYFNAQIYCVLWVILFLAPLLIQGSSIFIPLIWKYQAGR